MQSKFLQTLRLGLKSLLLHKLRAALAMLGILIGVTAVIWLVAMGEGVSYQAQQQIKDLGATNIIVRSVKPSQNSSSQGPALMVAYGVLREDYDRIRKTVPTVQRIAAMRELRREARFLDRALDIRLVGCTQDYQEINNLHLSRGRFLSQQDLADVANVCVIGHETARRLFPLEDPIGKSLLVDTTFYVIVGQTQARDPTAAIGGSLSGQEYNLDVYVPLTTLRWRVGDMVRTARSGTIEGEIVELSQITVTVKDIEYVDATAQIIEKLLKKSHKNEDYAVVVPKELLEQAENTRMMFNLLLVVIAGIALLVGGIGIMNIMLATVTERTREIGIRRALGARRKDIVQQFLCETVVLSAAGGLLGVALGFACKPVLQAVRAVLGSFLQEQMAALPPIIQKLEPRLALWSVGASFGISLAVGILFGLYPAWRAAMMDPIEALRHE